MLKSKSGAVVGLTMLVSTPQLSHAEPLITGVSGSITNASSVTISGSGFGSKATAAPYRWDNFEQGSPGELVSGWSGGTGSDRARYSSDVQRGPVGHAITSKHEFRPSAENVSLCQNDYTDGYPVLYLDYWYRLTTVDGSGFAGRNYKPWRVWTNDVTMQMNPTIFAPVAPYGPGGLFTIYDNGDPPQLPGTNLWNGEDRDYGTWKHEQVIFRTSTPGVADGVMYRYVNSTPSTAFSDTLVFRTRDILPTEIRIGHYWATDADPGDPVTLPANTGADAYIDDLYIDRSWARVEIGDETPYDACTHREIQIPNNWADGTIGVTINSGSFANGQHAFVYVVDSYNVVNADGFPVTFGSGSAGDTTPPAAPSGLHVP